MAYNIKLAREGGKVMKKNRRRRNLLLAARSKSQMAQQTCLTTKNRHHASDHVSTGNLQGWYQFRKRANQRVRNLSNGNLEIIENGYRGDHERHWLRDQRCEHVFRASLKEVVVIGANYICPFCHGTTDMQRYGSVEAIREHVHCISLGLIEFSADNALASSTEMYKFLCTVHRIILETSFDQFIEHKGEICSICDFEKEVAK
jgi:hypothetical protein